MSEHASNITDGLNPEQRTAVTHENGPLLIIAGAGTGKTTVVTRRIAHLIESGLAQPEEILALTFTEKAAGEMEERVDSLLPMGFFDLWISTFHSFGERILKDHALDIGLPNDFTLLSDTEQWLLLREHIEEFELDYYRPKGNPSKFVQGLISHFSRLKDEDILPEEYLEYAQKLQLDLDGEVTTNKANLSDEQKARVDEAQRVMEVAKAYAKYQQLLRDNSALDFGDLIVETIHLFKERPHILEKFRSQFKYILVDEFQDTNFAQYDLIKLLASPRNNLTVVADDDQAIYSFRGASMSNILIFKNDFPDATDVSLVQNYRSKQGILDLAYDVIQHNNPNRLEETLKIDKHLQSNNAGDATIEHLHSESLEGEAKMVADKIIALKERDPELLYSDFAILVRANNHAEAFIPYIERSGLPYQFLASQGLFSKTIILDVIAFLKLLDNPHESRVMYRVLTYPHWDIPSDDIITITRAADKATQSLYEACKDVRAITSLSEQTYTAVDKILSLIGTLSSMTRDHSAGEVALKFLEQSGYLQWVTSQDESDAQEGVLYLNQFYKYIEAFERAQSEKTVKNFVRELSMMIDSGEQGRLQPDFENGPDSVKIMTVHASKGLEFEHVFVVNMVDKRFPATGRKESIPIPDEIIKDVLPEGDWHVEEERRLFYVAMTRAKTGLFFTSGQDYGGARKKKLSRFLVEAGFENTQPEPTGEVVFGAPTTISVDQAKRELKHLPKSFSFTQLKAYETCPWQYRFAFLLKVPTPGKPSFSFGKTIHSTLYEFFRRMKEGAEMQQGELFSEQKSKKEAATGTLEELLDIYEHKWIQEWYNTQTQRDEYYEKGKQALKAFYELHADNWPKALLLEKGFNIKLGEYSVKGAIDRVDAVEGGVAVVDYKTGNFPKSGKKDVEQLYLYALALKEIMDVDPVTLQYYYVEDNKTIDQEFDPEKMEEVREWALGMIEQILRGDFTPTPGFHCQFCDFKDICEYKQ